MGTGDRLAIPRFLRETSRERGPDVTPSSFPASSLSPASPNAGEVEPSMVEELQRRKAAFLAHFKSSSTPLSSTEDVTAPTVSECSSNRSLDVAMTSQSGADSKCHVCNVSLRLLRVRVGFIRWIM